MSRMTDSERLDIAKGEFINGYEWQEETKQWLIGRAEKFEEMENEIEHLKSLVYRLQEIHFVELEREKATVKRYEKVLKEIATPGTGRGYWEAKKVLEEEI